MTLQAELAALATASDKIATIRRSITDEHTSLKRQVEDLLDARWNGDAASQFRAAWERWCLGMNDVLSGLGVESAAIAVTRAQLIGTDEDQQAAIQALHQRLGTAGR